MTIGISPSSGGPGLLDGSWLAALAQGQNNACQSVIAHAGAARETATPILPSSILVAITTVANAGDSIRLPAAKAGMVKMVLNATANSANIYGYRASDAFNGVTGDPFAIDGDTAVIFSCPNDGLWAAVLGGGGGGDYVAKAVTFVADSDARLTTDSLITSDSPLILMSGWYNMTPEAMSDFPYLWFSQLSGTIPMIGALEIGGANDTDIFSAIYGGQDYTPSIVGDTADGLWTALTWHHVAFSARTDRAAGLKRIQISYDGVVQSLSITDADGSFTIRASGAPFGFPNMGDRLTGNMDAADFQFWMDVDADLTDPGVLENLIKDGKPVDPAVAAAAFGDPAILFSGDVNSFGINQGTGGAFALNGILTNATTSPSD